MVSKGREIQSQLPRSQQAKKFVEVREQTVGRKLIDGIPRPPPISPPVQKGRTRADVTALPNVCKRKLKNVQTANTKAPELARTWRLAEGTLPGCAYAIRHCLSTVRPLARPKFMILVL